MELRDSEQRHDGIADELLHRTPVRFDRGVDRVEVDGHHLAIRLGVESHGEPRRVDDVAEEDGDDAAGLSRLGPHGARARERGVLLEDHALERAQLLAGLEAQLDVERATRIVIGGERIALPSCAVQREHELSAQALT